MPNNPFYQIPVKIKEENTVVKVEPSKEVITNNSLNQQASRPIQSNEPLEENRSMLEPKQNVNKKEYMNLYEYLDMPKEVVDRILNTINRAHIERLKLKFKNGFDNPIVEAPLSSKDKRDFNNTINFIKNKKISMSNKEKISEQRKTVNETGHIEFDIKRRHISNSREQVEPVFKVTPNPLYQRPIKRKEKVEPNIQVEKEEEKIFESFTKPPINKKTSSNKSGKTLYEHFKDRTLVDEGLKILFRSHPISYHNIKTTYSEGFDIPIHLPMLSKNMQYKFNNAKLRLKTVIEELIKSKQSKQNGKEQTSYMELKINEKTKRKYNTNLYEYLGISKDIVDRILIDSNSMYIERLKLRFINGFDEAIVYNQPLTKENHMLFNNAIATIRKLYSRYYKNPKSEIDNKITVKRKYNTNLYEYLGISKDIVDEIIEKYLLSKYIEALKLRFINGFDETIVYNQPLTKENHMLFSSAINSIRRFYSTYYNNPKSEIDNKITVKRKYNTNLYEYLGISKDIVDEIIEKYLLSKYIEALKLRFINGFDEAIVYNQPLTKEERILFNNALTTIRRFYSTYYNNPKSEIDNKITVKRKYNTNLYEYLGISKDIVDEIIEKYLLSKYIEALKLRFINGFDEAIVYNQPLTKENHILFSSAINSIRGFYLRYYNNPKSEIDIKIPKRRKHSTKRKENVNLYEYLGMPKDIVDRILIDSNSMYIERLKLRFIDGFDEKIVYLDNLSNNDAKDFNNAITHIREKGKRYKVEEVKNEVSSKHVQSDVTRKNIDDSIEEYNMSETTLSEDIATFIRDELPLLLTSETIIANSSFEKYRDGIESLIDKLDEETVQVALLLRLGYIRNQVFFEDKIGQVLYKDENEIRSIINDGLSKLIDITTSNTHKRIRKKY